MKGKLPINSRVKWKGSPKYHGTIIKYIRFMDSTGYVVAWDNHKIGQHSDFDLIPIIDPNNLLKNIL